MPLDSKSVVEAFNVIEQDGQNVNLHSITLKWKSLFSVKTPKGADVDDQRQSLILVKMMGNSRL
jgi:hypothetical protein